LKRLEAVARLYYEQDLSQEAIARRLRISRPYVSRMLSQAKEAGIVKISILSQAPPDEVVEADVRETFQLNSVALVEDGPQDSVTNESLGKAALQLIDAIGGGRLGLGWGNVIGTLVAGLERRPSFPSKVTDVTPLVGNRGIPIRHYHSNENARIAATQLQAQAHYLHAPSLAETKHELDLLRQTEHYKAVLAEWQQLDVALVNIGNHPSTPDFATAARYGNLLTQRHAVGRLIAYYYDVFGEIIHSEQDYAIQIPLEILGAVPRVIGIVSANVSTDALMGALRTGQLTDIVVHQSLMASVMSLAAAEGVAADAG
jgi:DNA-binding transcriptional regulator LsrR (DeoR family)